MLSHVDRGVGSGALCFHGFALDSRVWEPQMRSLHDRHRIIALDLPGYGPKPTAPVPGVSSARAALEVLDALGLDRVHVVGHSLGGAVAADFALAFPHRVRTLVLVSAVFRGRPAGAASWSRCCELARAGKLAEAREAWLGDPLFAASLEHADTAARLRAMVSDYAGGHWRDEVSTIYESAEPPGARLAELRAQTLVLVGDRDVPSFREMSDDYVRALPHARKVVLPGVGHMPNLEAPAAFDAAVTGFFAS